MKLDGETIYAHSTLPSRLDSQFFSYDNNTVETAWNVNKEIMGEERKIISDQDIKKCDCKTDLFISQEKLGEARDLPRLHDLLSLEERVISGEGKETEDPLHSNCVKLAEKETEFYTDKSVTELEIPELNVCFEELDDHIHVVKDIWVNDGLPSHVQIFIENSETCSKGDISLMSSNMDVHSDSFKENVESVVPISDGRNPFVDCESKTDVTDKYGSETINETDEDFEDNMNEDSVASILYGSNPFIDCDSRTDAAMTFDFECLIADKDISFNKYDCEARISNGTNPFLDSDSEADVAEEAGRESFNQSSEEGVRAAMDEVSDKKAMNRSEDQQQFAQETSEEAHSADSTVPSATGESNDCCTQKVVSFDSQLKSEGTSYDFDSSAPTSVRDEESEMIDCQPSVEASSMPSILEEVADSRTSSSRSFFIQHGHGEASFSATGSLSGPLAFSGPIPYSGSISLRSDSSTTSTRSFAFPVLNTEWNSSPVRMAKAERRHLRKHQGWRTSLLCCRF